MKLDNFQMVTVALHHNTTLLLDVSLDHNSEGMCFPVMAAVALSD